MHIHGHTFWVLATSEHPAASESSSLRRDVVTVAAHGWAALLLVADNPGVWTFHCHIEWHLAAGLVAELHEATESLTDLQVPQNHIDMCSYHPPHSTTHHSYYFPEIETTTFSLGFYFLTGVCVLYLFGKKLKVTPLGA